MLMCSFTFRVLYVVIALFFCFGVALAEGPRRPPVESKYAEFRTPHVIPTLPEHVLVEGGVLPGEVVIRNDASSTGASTGTAFSIDGNGNWVTARHVVDRCSEIYLIVDAHTPYSLTINGVAGTPAIKAAVKAVNYQADLALLNTEQSIAYDLNIIQSSENVAGLVAGFAVGFPGSQAGELSSLYLGRTIAQIPFVAQTVRQEVLVWSLVTLNPSDLVLQGISGGPLLDDHGRVLGVNTAGNVRRGRLFTSIPEMLGAFVYANGLQPSTNGAEVVLHEGNFMQYAGLLRNDYTVAQVVCFY